MRVAGVGADEAAEVAAEAAQVAEEVGGAELGEGDGDVGGRLGVQGDREGGGVAVHEPDDAAARPGRPDDDLGAAGAGDGLAVLAEAGVEDLDVRAAVGGDQRLAAGLVRDDDVGHAEPGDGA